MSNADEEPYAARRLYDAKVASHYNSQYTSPLGRENLRAKTVAIWEEKAFDELLPRKPGQKVLDVACGTGRYLKRHLAAGHVPTGIDISPDMLGHARHNLGGADVPLLTGDAEKLPFDDDSFDGVTCVRLYQRVPPAIRVQMLKEVKRVARDWGLVYFGGTTRWLDVRRTLRTSLLGLKYNGQYRARFPEILEELRAAGVYVVDFRWVMPLLTDGVFVLVRW